MLTKYKKSVKDRMIYFNISVTVERCRHNKFLILLKISCYKIIGEMGLPATDFNLRQKFQENKLKKILKTLIFNFLLGSNLSQDSLHFSQLRILKNYFLFVKIFFEFCQRIA